MTRALSDFDADSYPWDSVWEYILDDRNFEEPARGERKKKPWSVAQLKRSMVDGSDSDSAYEEVDDIRRVKEPKPNLKPQRPILQQPKMEVVEVEKPKRTSRFAKLIRKRLRRKKKEQEPSSTPPAEHQREKFKVRFQDDEEDYRSDFGLSRVPSFLQRRSDDVSVSGNQSVGSETSSVLRLLQWRKQKEVVQHDFENLSDEELSDEVSVMESIFRFEETRSDFDVDSRNRYRAKQQWRNSNRRRSHDRPPELRRSLSDLFDARETSSVQSSQSRRSRHSRLFAEDSSVNFLMETQGGYLVHVPKSIAFGPNQLRRKNSFQGY